MELIQLTQENLEREHICCAISASRDIQVRSKKAWLAERLPEGLVFLKGNVRGKCFIEYLPAEVAWAPIEADGYYYIDCFWVAGKYQGQGNADLLLEACIQDGRKSGKQGLCVLSSQKKRPFLSDPGYLRHRGFLVADEALPYFTLFYLPLEPSARRPQFRAQAKTPRDGGDGFALYYTNQCPFCAKYVPLLERAAAERGIPLRCIHIANREQAQRAPAPCAPCALFYRGGFVTNEMLSERRFLTLAEELQGRSVP